MGGTDFNAANNKLIMEILEKYKNAFIESFEIEEQILENLEYRSIEVWDSVGHMTLIATLEEHFDIMMETEDIINFSSFQKGKELLKKYNIIIK